MKETITQSIEEMESIAESARRSLEFAPRPTPEAREVAEKFRTQLDRLDRIISDLKAAVDTYGKEVYGSRIREEVALESAIRAEEAWGEA